MKNAPSVFQREMQRVLRDKLGKGVLVFIDDILIYSATVEEHESLVRWVLQRLCEEGYYANPDKCDFFQSEVSFLGHLISEKGISVQQHKVKAVREWPQPTTKKQVKAFLGLTGYYRKFIEGYSRVALPLTELTKDKVRFEWGPQQQEAFETLKTKLTEAPVLAHPDPAVQYILNTDASGFAIAAVLSQKQADGGIRPVAYYSKKMGSAEVNYSVHDQELLAIVMAVDHWRCYLDGSPHPTMVLTDHKGLQWLNSKAELTGREARWVERLSDVDYEVQYVPGPQNAVADALSRRADFDFTEVERGRTGESGKRLNVQLAEVTGTEVSEEPQWAVKADFHSRQDGGRRVEIHLTTVTGTTVSERPLWQIKADFTSTDAGISPSHERREASKVELAAVTGEPTSEQRLCESKAEGLLFREELREAVAADPWYSEKMKEVNPTDGLLRGDGLLWTYDGRFYVPADREVQRKLLYEVHDAPTGGHLGGKKTLHKLQNTCYWPGMGKDIEDYVRGCVVCAATKPSQRPPSGLLQPLPIPHRPWEVISIDFVGPLPRTKDYFDAVLVVVDKFSKMAHFIPTTTQVDAAKTAKLLISNVFKLHGLPSSIISDRDPRFTAGLWRKLFRAWGTQLKMSSSYHPQTDGQTERLNRTLEAGIRAYADRTRGDWVEWLPMVEAFYNSSTHESTGKTPFELNGVVWTDAMTIGFNSPVMNDIKSQAAEDLLKGMKQAWEDARMLLLNRRERMKRYADKGRRDEKYEVGDRVLLSTRNLTKHRSKLSDPFIGPFTVTRVSDHGVNVWLDLPSEYGRLHQPFHVEKVKRYTPSAVEWGRTQVDRPLPEVIDGEAMWEVEMLLGKREGEEFVDVVPDVEGGEEKDADASEEKEEKDDEGPPQPTQERDAPLRRSARLAQQGMGVGGGGGGGGGGVGEWSSRGGGPAG
jgi:transposase InsO family protein